MSTHLTAQTTSAAEPAVADDEHGSLVRSLSASLPKAVGNLLAALVVLVTLAFGVWSLIATWSGHPDSALPLFQTSVAGTVVALNALYARGTFSYVITLIGAILWLWVSIIPFAPFWQVVMQAATITVMLAGVVFSTAAVALSTKPRF
ncbi:ABC-type glycine betaine transport, permease [Leifsonia xyli subsp. cynodontis DSM 46306]|uniref:Uncharacterized protein n=1 Tax=Leifsonia xyli subsp. cynodontis DSM 46306 TaxID=1389489 RepID=U3P632_LEIXC|nr:hypothetical protein [Leifsonia xyli]AGW41785.1 ABC-type glycine betaine transport, permease [Leifsonia xyli subsp. cynodontis DSM 46306]